MSVVLPLTQVLDYSDYERRRWREWLAADPARLRLPFQEGRRFSTVWNLLDHLFLVERRHLARLQGATPPDATGVAAGDLAALFEYANSVRADLRTYIAETPEAQAREPITFTIPNGTYSMSRLKLITSILLHEVRHLAQLAYCVRLAGDEPPGEHDYLFGPTP
jgi:uncharacterized damage-inducible protein DinB